ncbi:MAG: ABC transporter permease [Deltaproteobacteria bacterium]|nr:ABC transporter permease [Deltaproteobacteria bacterium]
MATKSVEGEPKGPPAAARRGRVPAWVTNYSYPLGAIVFLLVFWEIFVNAMKLPAYLLPPPSLVFGVVATQSKLLALHAVTTTMEVLLGFVMSVIIGIPLAVGIVSSRFFDRSIYPILVSSQSVPKIAIAPLFVVWFGFGTFPKVLVAFLISFFPIVISTVVGLRSVEPEMIYLIRSMGAGPMDTFRKIRFPNALPSIFGGLKIAITLSVVGAIVGEFIGADRGLGYLLLVANSNLDTKLLFAAIVYLAAIGIIRIMIVERIERALIPWHVSRRTEVILESM